MCHKILAFVAVFVALALAILAVALPPANLAFVIIISRFFEVMIPVLAVAALLKYLFCCVKSSNCNEVNRNSGVH